MVVRVPANLTETLTFIKRDDHAQVMFKGLAELLPRVAMDDRTVIITSRL